MSQLHQFPCSRPTDRHHVSRQALLQLQEVALQGTAEIQAVRLFECCLAASSCIPSLSLPLPPSLPVLPSPLLSSPLISPSSHLPHTHTVSIEISGERRPQTCLSTQISSNSFLLASSHSYIGTISQAPSESTHATSSPLAANTRSSGRYPPLDIAPESSSIFQGFGRTQKERISGIGPAISSTVQLRIFSELFTKSLRNRCNQFWRIHVQQHILLFIQGSSNVLSQTSFPCSSK